MSNIVIYFSRAGSNWVEDGVKNIDIGNCKLLAKYIQKKIGSDIFEIKSKKVYTNEYYKATEEAKQELNNNERPELIEYPNLDKYDTIYLVYPIWWSTCPMAVFSLLEKEDFTNKTIIPFCTHEGSGIANSVNDIKKYSKCLNVKDAFETRGYKCQNINNDENLKQAINKFIENNQ